MARLSLTEFSTVQKKQAKTKRTKKNSVAAASTVGNAVAVLEPDSTDAINLNLNRKLQTAHSMKSASEWRISRRRDENGDDENVLALADDETYREDTRKILWSRN